MVVVTLRIVFNPSQELVPAFWLLLIGMIVHVRRRRLLHVRRHQRHPRAANVSSTCPICSPTWGPARAPCTPPCANSPRSASSAACRRRGCASRSSRWRCVIPALLTLANDSRTFSDRIVLCVLMLAMTVAAVLRIAQALQHGRKLRGTPRVPGQPRQPHRPPQPPHDGAAPVRPSRRAGHRRHPRGRPLPRPRPLQADQRHARPQPRRRTADRGGRAPARQRAAERPRHPHRRRRVHDHPRSTWSACRRRSTWPTGCAPACARPSSCTA